MADDKLVSKAIEILEKHGSHGRMSPDDAIDTLAGFPPFDGMDDEELAPIATAALTRRGPAAAPRASGDDRKALPARTRAAPDAAMLTAPYRFVVIDDRVVPAQPETKTASWGFPIKGGFSGDIEVEWAFETPMLIGIEDEKGVSGPMKLGDDYVIPGASLRGMMRASMGIVCRARLTQINAHHRYGVRDFTHPLFSEGQGYGAKRLAWGNLKSGWLRKARPGDPEKKDGDSDYVLTPCDKKIVRIRALPPAFNGGMATANGQWHRDWLGTKLAERYKRAGYVRGQKGRSDLFDFETSSTTAFMHDPLIKPNDPTASDHVIPGGGGVGNGWFVFSNNSPSLRDVGAATLDQQEAYPSPGNQKKREYVFFDRPGAQPVRLRQDVFDRFELINSKPGKTKLKPDGSYAVMEPTLKAERRIPVFYAGDLADQELDFDIGLTRLFKLSHENSVGAVLERQKAHKLTLRETPDERRVFEDPDMVEALFGHVYDHVDFDIPKEPDLPVGAVRKGRIAFGFARLTKETPAAETGVVTTVAMTPRASYAPFYLRGPIKDWTDEAVNGRKGDARLAGRKRYFARFPRDNLAKAEDNVVATLSQRRGEAGADAQTKLRLLKPRFARGDLVFRGTIRLHNVTAEEVGALLWTLTHGGDTAKPYRHMIGRAKNAGAGQARVKAVCLKLAAHCKESEADKLVTPQSWETQGVDGGWTSVGGQLLGPFLQAFEAYMKERDPAWPQADDISELLGAGDPANGAELKADFLPTPNDHGKLRRLVKADVNNDPASVNKVNDRLMPAPRTAQVLTPYR